jgi:hypothetical protein
MQAHILAHVTDVSTSIDQYLNQQLEHNFDLLAALVDNNDNPNEKNKHPRKKNAMVQQNHSSTANNNAYENEKNNRRDHNDDLQPILKLLDQAGYDITNDEEIQKESLPRWSAIRKAYGPPKIIGLESCSQYQKMVDPKHQHLGVAGLFNSGTNLLHSLLTANCVPSNIQTVKWQVRPSFYFQLWHCALQLELTSCTLAMMTRFLGGNIIL